MRVLAFFIVLVPLLGQEPFEPDVPRTWDSTALEEWATPLAGLNKRPGHFSEQEYYAAPVTNLRTYPVYYPGREPDGYWKMLNSVGPKPLIEPEELKTRQDWIRAGKRVFEEYDFPSFRTWDPKIIAAARSVATFERVNYVPRPDGHRKHARQSSRHDARWRSRHDARWRIRRYDRRAKATNARQHDAGATRAVGTNAEHDAGRAAGDDERQTWWAGWRPRHG